MSDVQLYLGDCLEVMKERLPDASIDLTVTSPPYDSLRKYNGYSFNFEEIATQLWRVTRLGGVVVWVVADQTVDGSETGTSFRQALYFMDIGFKLHDTMIYETDKPPMNDRRYQACFEYMFVFVKGKLTTFNPIKVDATQANKKRTAITYRQENGCLKNQWRGGTYSATTVKKSIWYFPSGHGKGTRDELAFSHPASFPESLAKDHILSWSNPGDTVLDCFLGSGTSGKIAKLLHRNFIGIEISEEYHNLAARRIEQAQAPAITEEGVFMPQPEQAPLFA